MAHNIRSTYVMRNGRMENLLQPMILFLLYSVLLILKPGAPYSWYVSMANIVNADKITKGEQSPDSLGVEAVNEQTLKITLTKPVPHFIKMLAHGKYFCFTGREYASKSTKKLGQNPRILS